MEGREHISGSGSVNQRSSRGEEIEKLKAQQQSYAHTLGNEGAGLAAHRTRWKGA